MKGVGVVFVGLLLFLLFLDCDQLWAGWSDYKESSLSTLVFCENEMNSKDVATCVPIPANKYLVKVTYTGNFRKIDWRRYKAALTCIDVLSENKGLKNMIGSYIYETQVKEGAKSYWLPIQDVLVPILKEVKEGEIINLYVIRLGAQGCEWLFFIMAF
jgi:hypothetical protein